MNLYEIEKAIYEFEFQIDEETGEILNAEELDNLKLEKETKVENVGLWIKNLRAEKEAVKAEKQNFADREKRLENKIKSLESYIYFATQGEPFKTDRLVISYRKSESVEIADGAKIPDDYIRKVVEEKPDKTALKQALKSGEKFEGVKLVEKQNLQLK